MPKLVSEINAGVQFSRSSEDNQLADSTTRAFRIVLNTPDEGVDIQSVCGVRIGDQHPFNPGLFCVSFTANYESDSRMVAQAAFNYQSSPSPRPQDPKEQPPPVRPSNWSTSTSLVEVPKSTWFRRDALEDWQTTERAAITPAGDIYDGITALAPIVSINIEQWEPLDPTRHNLHAGSVNSETITLGSLVMKPGTVMFRGAASQPALEYWGELLYRGWRCTYEFAFRRNTTRVFIGGIPQVVDIGWDIAVPLSGFNVRAFAPNGAAADEDVFGQPLDVQDKDGDKPGTLKDPPALPPNVAPGARVPAMVQIAWPGGSAQARAASPVALKPNGRPLKTHDANGNLINEPYVYAYRVQPLLNFTNTLGLRLE